jgi:hypothetical protein
MKLRLLLQPIVAIVLAVIAGLKDARLGKPPYGWSLFTDAAHRRDLLRDGWKSVGKVFIVAMVLDAIYQWIVARVIYPGELVLVAVILALVPYLIVRGLVTRISRRIHPRG